MTSQPALVLGIGVVPAPHGLYWVCGDCLPRTNGKYGLIWQPPDQKRGKCVHCGQMYEFSSKYGETELARTEEA